MSVKYEDWKIALDYFQKNSYMISFDLMSGYPHIDIFKGHQFFLAFFRIHCFTFWALRSSLYSNNVSKAPLRNTGDYRALSKPFL